MPKKSIKVSDSVAVITRYDQLRELIRNFAKGNIGLLAIVGRPGLSKSKGVENAVKDSDCYLVKGRVSPLSLYTGLYAHQDDPVLIDDADDVMSNKLSREYVKGLTETDQYKRLSWQSKSKILVEEGVPPHFWTESSCCIITNSWDSNDPIYSALESRAEFVLFEPDWSELYQECATWFWDQEIFDYLHERLDSLKQPDCRILVKAADRKKAGMKALPWRKLIDNYCDDEAGLELRKVLDDKSFKNNTARQEAWSERVSLDRATFYRRKAAIEKYRPEGKVKRLVLKRKTRPTRLRPNDGYLPEKEELSL